jgi:hypothetical protein
MSYIYTVYEERLYRAEVAKRTPMQVKLVKHGDKPFGYRTVIPNYQAHCTPEIAISAWRREMDELIRDAERKLSSLRSELSRDIKPAWSEP